MKHLLKFKDYKVFSKNSWEITDLKFIKNREQFNSYKKDSRILFKTLIKNSSQKLTKKRKKKLKKDL
jgi:hypothetical protein